jgi:hypothetical protein
VEQSELLLQGEKDVVSTIIHEEINIVNRVERDKMEDLEVDEDPLGSNLSCGFIGTKHVSLNSPKQSCTIQFLETQFNQDSAFKDF